MNTYRKDCFYFSEVIDFGGHIPFCCCTAKLEDCPCRDCKYYISKSEAYQVVRKYQDGEIVAVRHGYWIGEFSKERLSLDEDGRVETGFECAVCSECGEDLLASEEYFVRGRYCPACGAVMDGKEQKNGQD